MSLQLLGRACREAQNLRHAHWSAAVAAVQQRHAHGTSPAPQASAKDPADIVLRKAFAHCVRNVRYLQDTSCSFVQNMRSGLTQMRMHKLRQKHKSAAMHTQGARLRELHLDCAAPKGEPGSLRHAANSITTMEEANSQPRVGVGLQQTRLT